MLDLVRIHPLLRPFDADVELPGSKSITNRALLMAALSDGPCRIRRALDSDDARRMVDGLVCLGFEVEADWPAAQIAVRGRGGVVPATSADLFVGNAGTAARFLAAAAALATGEVRLDGVPRMRERPMGDLFEALRSLGAEVQPEQGRDALPALVRSSGVRGGEVSIRAGSSSQFVSALLLIGPCCPEGLCVRVEGPLVSEPYVAMTLEMMRRWGGSVEHGGSGGYAVSGTSGYRWREWLVEPDASGATYFMAAAAVTCGRALIVGLGRDSLQGDVAFADVLEQMGCTVEWLPEGVQVRGPERLSGVEVDMNGISDTVMSLAAIAPFASGPVSIRNVAHIRGKETDRVAAVATELTRLGVVVEEAPDGLTIQPARELRPALVQTYDDHRMAMSFAVAGLAAPGVAIANPECVNKTYPGFWRDLEEATASAR
ncbi:MAG: 3-phosphoshikimate 1-carboxyvinyltransferase [Armatimonadetes bacterium]|nr:3-phosphoshikimate 1-carboxyvinyltransferase [Armatimonadota bacterium]